MENLGHSVYWLAKLCGIVLGVSVPVCFHVLEERVGEHTIFLSGGDCPTRNVPTVVRE